MIQAVALFTIVAALFAYMLLSARAILGRNGIPSPSQRKALPDDGQQPIDTERGLTHAQLA